MTSLPRTRLLVGYELPHNHSPENLNMGIATISGQCIEHELHLSMKPHSSIDVGRDENGDLVWVTMPPRGMNFTLTSSELPSTLPTYFEPETNRELPEPPGGMTQSMIAAFTGKLKTRKKLIAAAAGVAGLSVVLGLGLVPAAGSEAPLSQPSSTGETSSSDVGHSLSNPRDAAIQFVLSGTLTGVDIPEHVDDKDLEATVVSQSGEIVLVDVQINSAQGLTTFATLLLQKSGTTWRIREVFDPR